MCEHLALKAEKSTFTINFSARHFGRNGLTNSHIIGTLCLINKRSRFLAIRQFF